MEKFDNSNSFRRILQARYVENHCQVENLQPIKFFNKCSEQYKIFQFADPTVLEKIRPWKQQLTELGNNKHLKLASN